MDGKQGTPDLQMQKTARGHGNQSAGDRQEPQKIHLVNRSGSVATKLLQPIPMQQHNSAPYRESVPGSKAIIDTFGTQYTINTKGLSALQIRRACEKAYMETFNQMRIVPDETYEPEFNALFQVTVQQKAARIMESKRRRCARPKRQPNSEI